MLTYNILTSEEYLKNLVAFIKMTEDFIPKVANIKDGNSTIGYGYTFERNNNVEVWKSSGVALSTSEWELLERIDKVPNNGKRTIALGFGKTLTEDESEDLLLHSYELYEKTADDLFIPDSWERLALTHFTYNRGRGIVQRTPNLFSAVRADDRAEAWFEIRYNSPAKQDIFKHGIAKIRYYESELFGLYNNDVVDNNGKITADSAYKVYRMFTNHREQIMQSELEFSKQIALANSDFKLTSNDLVETLEDNLFLAAEFLIKQYDIPESLQSTFSVLDIQVASDEISSWLTP